MLRTTHIRTKLAVALAVPLAALVAVAGFEVVQARAEVDQTRSQSELATSSIGPGSLVTRLQDERNRASIDLIGLDTELPVDSNEEARPLTDAADGGYYMIRVDDVTPAATRPFADVREQVTADWLSDSWAKAAAEKATAIVGRLNAGESLTAIATELGTEVSTSKPVKRDGSDVAANLPAAVVPQLFTLKQGEVAAVADGGDQIILRLAEIRTPTDGGDPAATADLRQALRGEMANDVVNQFMAALQQEIDVSVNNDAIDQLF